MSEADLRFPDCCSYCPHQRAVKGSCSHEFRQSLVDYFAVNGPRPCPVFTDVKTAAMRALGDRLRH